MPSATDSTTAWAAVGTPAAAITSLAKAFEPSSRAAAADGPKHGDAGRGARVGQAGHERRLGADHDEVHALGDSLRREVVAADDPRLARDARVAGRAQQLRGLRRARERAHDRVLAPAAADDEDLRHREAMKSSIGIAASDS